MMKITFVFCILLFFFYSFLKGQIQPPYHNDFDSVITTGWIHGFNYGNDDWELGDPGSVNLSNPLSYPNVWATNLNDNCTENSYMYLQSPAFDLSDTTEYILTLYHKYNMTNSAGGNIYYSVDNGINWYLLDGAVNEKVNWYNSTYSPALSAAGWTGDYYMNYKSSTHSLAFLSGQSNVIFRFCFGCQGVAVDGWMIDDFSIYENDVNIIANQGGTVNVSKYFSDFNVISNIYYYGLVTPIFSNVTDYFFSLDSVLDAGDSLLGTFSGSVSGSVINMIKTFPMIQGLNSGDYYIFFRYDVDNNLDETNENDNISFSLLHVDSTFVTPYKTDFEPDTNDWLKYSTYTSNYSYWNTYWEIGKNNIHKIFGTHSGENAYYISSLPQSNSTSHYLVSPYFDINDTITETICFWYKMNSKYNVNHNFYLMLSRSDGYPDFNSPVGVIYEIPIPRRYNWDCYCHDLSFIGGHNNSKIGFDFISYGNYTNYSNYVVIDDIYIGQPKPDLYIESQNMRSLNINLSKDTLFYNIFNSGLSGIQPSITKFYWSLDSIYDISDLYLGYNNEPVIPDTGFVYRNFRFSIPTYSSGAYYIIAIADADSTIDEMWETNNTSVFSVFLTDYFVTPYGNGFENQITNWFHNSLFGQDQWEWTVPMGTYINQAFSGQKAFVTNSLGQVESSSFMVLYTPVFDLSTLNTPVLSFDLFLETYINNPLLLNRPSLNISWSHDNGATWTVLNQNNSSYQNWYHYSNYNSYGGIDFAGTCGSNSLFFELSENAFCNSGCYQGRDEFNVTKNILDISHLKGYPRVQFRFNFSTPLVSIGEGAMIDNFLITEHYTDLAVDYHKDLIKSPDAHQLRFFVNVTNKGNFISDSTQVSFYLSTDSVFDTSDEYIGYEPLKEVRPGTNKYLNIILDCPQTLNGKNYLIMQLDSSEVVVESDETNNIVCWPLTTSGIQQYPYYCDFSDTVLNGWTQYSFLYGTHKKDIWRFRNILATNEITGYTQIQSGEMFTDQINDVLNIAYVPFWYLETPNFNFSNLQNIMLTFDMLLVGEATEDGGNLEFSTDGGNTWQILTSAYGNTVGWYNSGTNDLYYLNDEPGWTDSNYLSARSIDLSFFAGQPSVVFRFKFRSNSGGYIMGMRIDNFNIIGDYISEINKEESGKISFFPNPSTGDFTILVNDPEFLSSQFEITDVFGKLHYKGITNNNVTKIKFQDIHQGVYFVSVYGKNSKITNKIVVYP